MGDHCLELWVRSGWQKGITSMGEYSEVGGGCRESMKGRGGPSGTQVQLKSGLGLLTGHRTPLFCAI